MDHQADSDLPLVFSPRLLVRHPQKLGSIRVRELGTTGFLKRYWLCRGTHAGQNQQALLFTPDGDLRPVVVVLGLDLVHVGYGREGGHHYSFAEDLTPSLYAVVVCC